MADTLLRWSQSAERMGRPTRTQLLRWVGYCGLGEFLGIAVAAAVALFFIYTEPPLRLPSWLRTVMHPLLAGAGEGLLLGWLQWEALRRIQPNLKAGRWIGITVLAAVVAWMLGMVPSQLAETFGEGKALAEPAFVVILGAGALMGLLLGTIFGWFQQLVLRQYFYFSRYWIRANALGWMLGMTLLFFSAGMIPANWPWSLILLVAALSGLTAGLSVGLITAWSLTRMPKKEAF